jgi:hypothetical protein
MVDAATSLAHIPCTRACSHLNLLGFIALLLERGFNLLHAHRVPVWSNTHRKDSTIGNHEGTQTHWLGAQYSQQRTAGVQGQYFIY